MALDTTVRARIDAELKEDVEKILSEIGISTSQAITMFMKGIKRERGIPFELKIPNEETLQAMSDAEMGINMEEVTLDEMIAEHKRGYGANR
ncbi:MAG: type II toxin-antitoxin system antitoxin, RelB/DinJ family [Sulfurovum sp.]|nr:MAG: type II toxin-antitoxin system antitoxin, RelB/DinJ family [Sulfurovum sp.]